MTCVLINVTVGDCVIGFILNMVVISPTYTPLALAYHCISCFVLLNGC